MASSPKKIIIDKEYNNTRIDKFISNNLFLPKSLVQKDLRKGRIKLNKKRVKHGHRLTINDVIIFYKNYDIKDYKKEKYLSSNSIRRFKKSIIFKDQDYMIINKWNGIASQGGTKISISIDDLIKHIPVNKSKPRLVHRLDKDTSGIMLLALNLQATRYFSRLFSLREIHKIYYAIVTNKPLYKKGTLRNEILEKGVQYPAETKYEIIKKLSNNLYYLKFFPKTGRKHQIRIHCSLNDFPILGDNKYNKSAIYTDKKSKKLFLHAAEIKFKDQSGRNIRVKAELPSHFYNYI